MEKRGTRLRIHLVMEAENLNMSKSRNTVAEITGSTHPEQVGTATNLASKRNMCSVGVFEASIIYVI